MLLSKPITAGEVVSIKLISGEEIIARLDEEHTDHVILAKPLSVSIGPNGLGMMPFMFLNSSNTVNIKQSHIIAMGVAKKEASDQYIQGTTGIALA
jgi:hypothetical protein